MPVHARSIATGAHDRQIEIGVMKMANVMRCLSRLNIGWEMMFEREEKLVQKRAGTP